MPVPAPRTLALAALAVVAFAGNSVLTRLALAAPAIGAADFTAIRLLAGAATLALLAAGDLRAVLPRRADAPGAFALGVYAVAFTFAYVQLGAAVGALILFAAVQLTLAALATLRGAPPAGLELLGGAVAFGGLAWLLAPGASAPPRDAALLMAVAGAAWGCYTMIGRGASDPFAKTARNFIATVPLAVLLLALAPQESRSFWGVGLAVASGAVTSALGYVIWYRALPGLSVASAGAAQLLAPALAAAGGIVWIGEPLSARFIAGSILILGGIAITLFAARPVRPAAKG